MHARLEFTLVRSCVLCCCLSCHVCPCVLLSSFVLFGLFLCYVFFSLLSFVSIFSLFSSLYPLISILSFFSSLVFLFSNLSILFSLQPFMSSIFYLFCLIPYPNPHICRGCTFARSTHGRCARAPGISLGAFLCSLLLSCLAMYFLVFSCLVWCCFAYVSAMFYLRFSLVSLVSLFFFLLPRF